MALTWLNDFNGGKRRDLSAPISAWLVWGDDDKVDADVEKGDEYDSLVSPNPFLSV